MRVWDRWFGCCSTSNDDAIEGSSPFACSNVANVLVTSRQLNSVLIENSVRDALWTALTYLNFDDKFKLDPSFNKQMLAQWLYSTVGMGAAIGIWGALRKYTWQDWKEATVLLCSASASVITWDMAQSFGISLGLNLGLGSEGAAYFAAIFTGLAEGPTQYFIGFLVSWLLMPADMKKKYYDDLDQDPKAGFCRFCAELGFSIIPGAIPGGVWQVVYAANPFGASTKDTSLMNIARLAGGSVTVAAVTGACNYAYAKVSDAVWGLFYPVEKSTSDLTREGNKCCC